MVVVGLLFSRTLFPSTLQGSAFIGRNIGRQKWRIPSSFMSSSSSPSAPSHSHSSTASSSSFRQRLTALKTRAKSRFPSAPFQSYFPVTSQFFKCNHQQHLQNHHIHQHHQVRGVGSSAVSSSSGQAGAGEGDLLSQTGETKAKQKLRRRRWVSLYVVLANLIGFFLYSQFQDAEVVMEEGEDVKAVPVGFWVSFQSPCSSIMSNQINVSIHLLPLITLR